MSATASAPRSEPTAEETVTAPRAPWPIYVAACPIELGRLRLQVGGAFPIQDKRQIRSYGPALGVPDADRRPLRELPYVTVRW